MWHWSVLYCTHQYRNDRSKWQIFNKIVNNNNNNNDNNDRLTAFDPGQPG